jgi:hypothetical protein
VNFQLVKVVEYRAVVVVQLTVQSQPPGKALLSIVGARDLGFGQRQDARTQKLVGGIQVEHKCWRKKC